MVFIYLSISIHIHRIEMYRGRRRSMWKEVGAFIFLLVWGSFIIPTLTSNTFYEGIYIEEVNVGGLTLQEAQEKVERYVQQLLVEKQLELYQGERKEFVSYKELGVEYLFFQTLEQAYALGRNKNWIESYFITCVLKKKPVVFSLTLSYDSNHIYSLLKKLQNNFSQKPKDAIIQRNHKEFTVIKEETGKVLDIHKTAEQIQKALERQSTGSIQVELMDWQPEYTKEQLEQVQYVLGSFCTFFNSFQEMRNQNIQQAAQKIHGTLLKPGDIFSAQEVLGEITKENGYVDAPVIVNGQMVPDIGGGICQVVTTVYNAVLFSELDVLERKNHSLPVSYVPLGRDAAFATGWLDFKFKNNTVGILYMECSVDKSELCVTIYGTKPKEKDRRVEFISQVEEIEKNQDVESEALHVKLYKRTYNKDQIVEEKLVNISRYKPKPAS